VQVDADDGFLVPFVVDTDCEAPSESSPVPGTDVTELEQELFLFLVVFSLVGGDEITLVVFARAPRDELLLLEKLFFQFNIETIIKNSHIL
jgi:hypothetical protein